MAAQDLALRAESREAEVRKVRGCARKHVACISVKIFNFSYNNFMIIIFSVIYTRLVYKKLKFKGPIFNSLVPGNREGPN
jgi:hypothetical protein